MTPAELSQRFHAACAIAVEAGHLMGRAFENRLSAESLTLKGPQDYLTETDGAAEELIRKRIAEAFPSDSFFGEEGGGDFGTNVWVVDPIDGTANFARGIPHFCTSIAFVSNGRIEVGAIYNPCHDELFAARRGAGATLNGRPMRVSGIAEPARAIIECGWSARMPAKSYVAVVDRVMARGTQVRRTGSGALGMAYVADGRSDGYCELHINSWDVLAGILMVEEAGGWNSDFLAGHGLTQGNPIIACTPALKDFLQKAMLIS